MDYSDWTIAAHKRVAILTILDDHSRFIISCRAYPYATVGNVIESFTTAAETHGWPQSTLTDNGRAFTTSSDRKNPHETASNNSSSTSESPRKTANSITHKPKAKSSASTKHSKSLSLTNHLPPASMNSTANSTTSSTTTTTNAHTEHSTAPPRQRPTTHCPKPHQTQPTTATTSGCAPTKSPPTAKQHCDGAANYAASTAAADGVARPSPWSASTTTSTSNSSPLGHKSPPTHSPTKRSTTTKKITKSSHPGALQKQKISRHRRNDVSRLHIAPPPRLKPPHCGQVGARQLFGHEKRGAEPGKVPRPAIGRRA